MRITQGMIQIYRRELGNYFHTPIGYVFTVSALLFNFLFFFLGVFQIVPAFWEAKAASIRGYMNLLPVSFLLLVPAISMRIWAEERKQGTFELLMTLPVSDLDLVVGKFLAAWTVVSGLIFASIPLALFIGLIGNMDFGTTIAMYAGSLLMAASYVSMGMVVSALTREQIVAFVMIFFLSLFMFLGNFYIVSQHLPGPVAAIIGFFSLSYHFSSFSRGVMDFADVYFYLSFIGIMILVNTAILGRER